MDLCSRITNRPLATMLLRQEAAVESDVLAEAESDVVAEVRGRGH